MCIEEENAGRLIYLDLLRIYAVSLVVLLHITMFVSLFGRIDSREWWITNLFQSLSRPGAPLFFMISGALILNKSEKSPLFFYRKKILKVLAPFLIWAVIYSYWGAYLKGQGITPEQIGRNLINGNAYFHLWFVYVILALYLLAPLIRAWLLKRPGDLAYVLFFWFAIVCLLPFTQQVAGIPALMVPKTVKFLGYFLLGFYLTKAEISGKWSLPASMLFLCLVTTAVGTYLLSAEAGRFVNLFYQYMTPTVVFMAVFTFILFKKINFEGLSRKLPSFHGAIALLSRTCFTVYLAHVLIAELLRSGRLGFSVYGLKWGAGIGIPLTFTMVLFSSFVVALIIWKTGKTFEIDDKARAIG